MMNSFKEFVFLDENDGEDEQQSSGTEKLFGDSTMMHQIKDYVAARYAVVLHNLPSNCKKSIYKLIYDYVPEHYKNNDGGFEEANKTIKNLGNYFKMNHPTIFNLINNAMADFSVQNLMDYSNQNSIKDIRKILKRWKLKDSAFTEKLHDLRRENAKKKWDLIIQNINKEFAIEE